MAHSTWKKLIEEAMMRHEESFHDVVGSTFENDEINREFFSGAGLSCGVPFTPWTRERVYFPVVYAGEEWVGSVPRNPCPEKTEHQGSE